MELSVSEVGERIGATPGATHKRLQRSGYTPKRYIGVNAMFELTEADLEILKQHSVRGRPKAKAPEKSEAKTSIAKSKKTAKTEAAKNGKK